MIEDPTIKHIYQLFETTWIWLPVLIFECVHIFRVISPRNFLICGKTTYHCIKHIYNIYVLIPVSFSQIYQHNRWKLFMVSLMWKLDLDNCKHKNCFISKLLGLIKTMLKCSNRNKIRKFHFLCIYNIFREILNRNITLLTETDGRETN